MTSRDHPDNTYKPIVCLGGSFIQRLAHRGYLPHPSLTTPARGLVSNNALTNNIRKVYECTAAMSLERTDEHQNKLG